MPKQKTKTTPKARARSAAAEAPKPTPQTAAPEPQPASMDPVGLRTPSVWSPRDVCPRPIGELTRTATLIRGISWTISYSTGPLVFRHGEPVVINESEFQRLSVAIDRVDFPDPSSGVRIERRIYKFIFHDAATGDQIEMPRLRDKEVGPLALSLAEQSERDRLFQGAEHTRR